MNRVVPPSLLLVALLMGAAAFWAITRSPATATATDGGIVPILSYPNAPTVPTMGPLPASNAAPALASEEGSLIVPSDLLATWQVQDEPKSIPGEGGNWVAEGDTLAQRGLGRASSLSAAITTLVSPDSYGDVSVSTAFYDTRNGTVGLLARQSERGVYRVRLHTDPTFDGEALVLEKIVDGFALPLVVNNGEPLYQRGAWRTLSLHVTGGQIKVVLDGVTVAETTDAMPLPAGRVGVLTRALGGISFGSLTVNSEN